VVLPRTWPPDRRIVRRHPHRKNRLPSTSFPFRPSLSVLGVEAPVAVVVVVAAAAADVAGRCLHFAAPEHHRELERRTELVATVARMPLQGYAEYFPLAGPCRVVCPSYDTNMRKMQPSQDTNIVHNMLHDVSESHYIRISPINERIEEEVHRREL